LVADDVVKRISLETVRRILSNHKLKPWRHHPWLSAKVPRDADFRARVTNIIDLYTRPLTPFEMVLCVDEKTSLQPRTRLTPTLPAQPVRVEHEYQRKGALNLFAAFDTRTGKVNARTAERLPAYVEHWNAHPFNWSTQSVAKVMTRCELALAA